MKYVCRSFILLLCLCALAVRVSGVHVHVALDHDETQHVSHVAIFDLHHAAHVDHDAHADAHPHDVTDGVYNDGHKHIEVNLDNQALSKKPGTDLGLDALLCVAILLCILLAPRQLRLPLTRQTAPLYKRLAYLRPPLRGPPLLLC